MNVKELAPSVRPTGRQHDVATRGQPLKSSITVNLQNAAECFEMRGGPLSKQNQRKRRERCTSASRSLATALLEGALARGLLYIGKDHGGQFLMSPGEQFRMSLDSGDWFADDLKEYLRHFRGLRLSSEAATPRLPLLR